jgi:hypothetical protein
VGKGLTTESGAPVNVTPYSVSNLVFALLLNIHVHYAWALVTQLGVSELRDCVSAMGINVNFSLPGQNTSR